MVTGGRGYGHWQTGVWSLADGGMITGGQGYGHWQTGSKTDPVCQTVITFDDKGKKIYANAKVPQKNKKKPEFSPFCSVSLYMR